MSINAFIAQYRVQLENAVRMNPSDYAYGVDKVPEVVTKMENALRAGNYSKDGKAFKATCRALGVSNTYKAINAFLGK